MRPFLALVMASASLAPVSWSQASDASEREVEISRELDAFIDQAMKDGLLVPAGTQPEAAPAVQPKAVPTHKVEAEALEKPQAAAEAKAAADAAADTVPARYTCPEQNPLDFSAVAEVSGYPDILPMQERVRRLQGAGDALARIELAKAYISLALFDEAMVSLAGVKMPEAEALKAISQLLHRRETGTSGIIRAVAGCDAHNRIWLAVEGLIAGDKASAEMFKNELAAFDALPIQLRISITRIVVPELDKLDEAPLAERVMSKFTDEQIANSSRLSFARAVLDIGKSKDQPVAEVQALVREYRYDPDALETALRYGVPLEKAQRSVLLDEGMTRISTSRGGEASVDPSLKFVLSELGPHASYVELLRLSQMPALKGDAEQKKIRTAYRSRLINDLQSAEPLLKLGALAALTGKGPVLPGPEGFEEIYRLASQTAYEMGLMSLGDDLSRMGGEGPADAAKRAALAFARGDHATVYETAKAYPNDQDVLRIAAYAAIDDGDTARLRTYEGRLDMDPETALNLIERDAAGSYWIVSQRAYAAAEKLTDELSLARLARVRALRAARGEVKRPQLRSVADIGTALDRSRTRIDRLSGEIY